MVRFWNKRQAQPVSEPIQIDGNKAPSLPEASSEGFANAPVMYTAHK